MRKFLFALCVAAIVLGTVSTSAAWPITQACTPGFFKNHPHYITGGSCFTLYPSTRVSAVFPGVTSCVGNLTILGLLESPTSVCGTGNTESGAEVILLRQAITRMLNGTNSFDACGATRSVINLTNTTIDHANATDTTVGLKSLADTFSALNNDQPCTIGQ